MSKVLDPVDGWYWIDFRDAQGVRHRRKISKNKKVAQEVLDGMLGNIARRVYLGVIEDSTITFPRFADIWLKRIGPKVKATSLERWTGIVENHLKSFFTGSLRGIGPADVDRYVEKRIKEKAAPASINRETGVLRHLMLRAVAWEYLSRNPMQGYKQLDEPDGRVRFLTADELQKLLAAFDRPKLESPLAKSYLKPFTLFSLNTGMRRNEVLGLRRKDIDWENRIATLEVTKNGETRRVPLNPAAIAALKSLPAQLRHDKFFPFRPHQVSVAFRRAVKAAKIDHFRLHDLRHCFASYHAMNGIQARGLQSLLGHKDMRMTLRYSHLSDDYLKDTVDSLNIGVEGIKTQETAAK